MKQLYESLLDTGFADKRDKLVTTRMAEIAEIKLIHKEITKYLLKMNLLDKYSIKNAKKDGKTFTGEPYYEIKTERINTKAAFDDHKQLFAQFINNLKNPKVSVRVDDTSKEFGVILVYYNVTEMKEPLTIFCLNALYSKRDIYNDLSNDIGKMIFILNGERVK